MTSSPARLIALALLAAAFAVPSLARADGEGKKPPAAHSPKHSRARIEAALAQSTQVEFLDTPLQDAMEFLAKLHDIRVLLDTKALEEAGIAPGDPINSVLSEVSLRSALNLILEPMKLDYMIKSEVLLITTRDKTEKMLETRVYWVDGLLVNAQGLATILTDTLEPAAWTKQGGPGSLTPISVHPQQPTGDPALMGASMEMMGGMTPAMGGVQNQSPAVIGQREGVVISQSQRMHRKIAELLEQLHAVEAK